MSRQPSSTFSAPPPSTTISTPPTSPVPPPPPASESATKLWTSMQTKLNEVELSSSLFFGASHAAALEELRSAQVALAQAWIAEDAEGGVKERLRKVEGKLENVAKAMGRVEVVAGGMWDEEENYGEDAGTEESEQGSVRRKPKREGGSGENN
ncbi:hypothetical protein EX30DRAFT_394479 [Ascodesmis nigricans]|uniref:Uncharacterized protein n=1 Tax=Ascodesmis nigricans TaxID=341454 RepID=A0A4V3SJA5_9PEZI|nr:hypothetical protein EX30DRAFT_394479 [Ascodesmis nigricans]